MRVQSPEVEVALGPYHEEARSLMNGIKTSEVEIAAIHDIDGTGFDYEMIEDIDIVNASVSNDNDGGNTAPQIQKGMHLDCPLPLAEYCPRERTAVFDRETFGCWGGGVGLRFGNRYLNVPGGIEEFYHFLSTGNNIRGMRRMAAEKM